MLRLAAATCARHGNGAGKQGKTADGKARVDFRGCRCRGWILMVVGVSSNTRAQGQDQSKKGVLEDVLHVLTFHEVKADKRDREPKTNSDDQVHPPEELLKIAGREATFLQDLWSILVRDLEMFSWLG